MRLWWVDARVIGVVNVTLIGIGFRRAWGRAHGGCDRAFRSATVRPFSGRGLPFGVPGGHGRGMTSPFARRGDYLGGSFVTPADVTARFVRNDPADRSRTLGTWPCSLWSVDQAVGLARGVQPEWAGRTLAARVRALRTVPDALDEAASRMAALITAETGKPPWEARAEVQATLRQLDVVLTQAPALLADAESARVRGRSTRRAVGVVAILSPFPYPAFIPAVHAVASLVGGNAVVLKPSSTTPACGQLLAEVLGRARTPRGLVSVVQGPRSPIGQALADHPGVDRVLFSGRPECARGLRERIGPRLLGRASSRSTAAVLCDAPIERAAFEVALGAFVATGQRCNGTGRVAVSEEAAEGFLPALARAAASLRLSADLPAGRKDGAFLGPLAREGDLRACLAWMEGVRAAGLPRLVEGGARPGPRPGNFVAPSVYLAPREGFAPSGGSVLDLVGPILEVVVVPGDDAAIELARAEGALSAAVFTRSRERFDVARARLPQGSVNWNRATVVASGRLSAADPDSWGGAGEGHLDLVRALTRPQAVMEGTADPPSPAEIPPGMEWVPGDPRDGGGGERPAPGNDTAERAAFVVARGQAAGASFINQG